MDKTILLHTKRMLQKPITNIHSNFICNCQKRKTREMSTKRWVNKQMVEHPYNGKLVNSKKEQIINAERHTVLMDEKIQYC